MESTRLNLFLKSKMDSSAVLRSNKVLVCVEKTVLGSKSLMLAFMKLGLLAELL